MWLSLFDAKTAAAAFFMFLVQAGGNDLKAEKELLF